MADQTVSDHGPTTSRSSTSATRRRATPAAEVIDALVDLRDAYREFVSLDDEARTPHPDLTG